MDQVFQQGIVPDARTLARKSWTAYVKTALVTLIGLSIGSAIFHSSAFMGTLTYVVIAIFAVYRFIEIRSVELYWDDSGVWYSFGVLPWNKGTRGVKWRDIESAVFYQSLGSWLFKSYTVRIAHRFTRTSEILLSNMEHGDDAVVRINGLHQDLIRDGALK
jgi:hypothetical protein